MSEEDKQQQNQEKMVDPDKIDKHGYVDPRFHQDEDESQNNNEDKCESTDENKE